MNYLAGSYDVAVIGAGHAGIEAGLACARMGLHTVVFTINLDAVGNMPCNPAIGGTGWAARWRRPPTAAASNTGCSTAAKVRRCTRCARRPTGARIRRI